MSEIIGNCIKIYVDHLKDISILTCLVRGPGNSSGECKVLGDFGSKYYKIRPTKDHRHDPAFKKTVNRHQQNNYIVQHSVDEIILQDNEKLNAEYESHGNIDSEIGDNNIYEIDNMSLDERK